MNTEDRKFEKFDIERKLEELFEAEFNDKINFITNYVEEENEVNVLIAIVSRTLKKMGVMKIIPRYRLKIDEESRPMLSITKVSSGNEDADSLLSKSENTRVTFLHRFIYDEDDPSILREFTDLVMRKSKKMGIIYKGFDLRYNEKTFEYAQNQYNEGNKKFYTNPSTAESD